MTVSHNETRTIKRLTTALATFLALYFVIGLSTFSLYGAGLDKSYPPFFHWFLFAYVPNEHYTVQYTVRFTGYKGTPLQPVFFGEADDIVPEAKANRARDGIRRLGRALEEGRTDDVALLRGELEAAYFPPGLQYEVVKVLYDPIARFKTGTLHDVTVLGNFHTL